LLVASPTNLLGSKMTEKNHSTSWSISLRSTLVLTTWASFARTSKKVIADYQTRVSSQLHRNAEENDVWRPQYPWVAPTDHIRSQVMLKNWVIPKCASLNFQLVRMQSEEALDVLGAMTGKGSQGCSVDEARSARLARPDISNTSIQMHPPLLSHSFDSIHHRGIVKFVDSRYVLSYFGLVSSHPAWHLLTSLFWQHIHEL
jgi:hypothetical protein